MWGAPNAKVIITCKVMLEEWVAHFNNAFTQMLLNVKHLAKNILFTL
jgi:hypothetical protein